MEESKQGQPDLLLASLGVTEDNFLDKVGQLEQSCVTNNVAISMHKYVSSSSNVRWVPFKAALSQVYQRDWTNMPESTLNSALRAVKREARKLQKSKNPLRYREFLQMPFSPPSPNQKRKAQESKDVAQDDVKPKRPAFDFFLERVDELTEQGLLRDMQAVKRENEIWKSELKHLKNQNQDLSNANLRLRNRLKVYSKNRFNQMVSRKNEQVQKWKNKYLEADLADVAHLKAELKGLRVKYVKLAAAKRKQQMRARIKISQLEDRCQCGCACC